MSNTTTTKQKDLLNTQLNAEENQDKELSSELIKRRQIEKTPFWVVHIPEKGYCLIFANVRVTDWFESETEAIQYITTNQWELICIIFVRMFEVEFEHLNIK